MIQFQFDQQCEQVALSIASSTNFNQPEILRLSRARQWPFSVWLPLRQSFPHSHLDFDLRFRLSSLKRGLNDRKFRQDPGL